MRENKEKKHDSPKRSEPAARWARRSSNDTASTIMIIRRFLVVALIKIIVAHQSSQLLQRRNLAATPTCRTTRTLVIDSARDQDTGRPTSTGHPLPPSRRTRIDHSGRSTWIKLEGAGTFHDTPYCCRECPATRFGRFAFAANFTPVPANSSSRVT